MQSLKLPATAEGMEVAVLILRQLFPNWSNKQIAKVLHRDPSRVRQVIRKHIAWIEKTPSGAGYRLKHTVEITAV